MFITSLPYAISSWYCRHFSRLLLSTMLFRLFGLLFHAVPPDNIIYFFPLTFRLSFHDTLVVDYVPSRRQKSPPPIICEMFRHTPRDTTPFFHVTMLYADEVPIFHYAVYLSPCWGHTTYHALLIRHATRRYHFRRYCSIISLVVYHFLHITITFHQIFFDIKNYACLFFAASLLVFCLSSFADTITSSFAPLFF